MKWVLWILLGGVVTFLIAGLMQHQRYLDIRRTRAMDSQAVFYSGDALHVATVLKLSPEQELLSAVGDFVRVTEAQGADVVYAGKIVANGLKSRQIPPEEWDAFVLAQFPSRAAYDSVAIAPVYQDARTTFQNSYSLGMHRSAALNIGLPIMFLGIRLLDRVTFQPSHLPFVPAEVSERFQTPDETTRWGMARALRAHADLGRDATVVLNFTKDGTATEQAANADYGRAMLSLMAETASGPMHIGPAVTLEGGAEFDQMVIVYYPGAEFFADLITSEFFTGIVGGKQLGDTQASPSVPLVPHL